MMKIVKSLAIIVAVAAIAGGGTYALFSDQGVIAGSTFTAGTLDLKIDSDPSSSNHVWSDGFTNPANPFANVKPGSTGEQIIDIKNEGNIDGINATIKFDVADGTWSALADNLFFTISYKGEEEDDSSYEPIIVGAKLSDIYGGAILLGELSAGKVGNVKIEWSVPAETGNSIQGKSITIDTTFGLEQAQ